MTNARLAVLTALLALLATSTFGDDFFHGDGFVDPGNGYAAPVGGPTFAGDGLPGGYENRIGSPYHYSGGYPAVGYGGDVYTNHFGPGYHRRAPIGHYRFPYYSYRRPWYHVGPPAYAADTNFAW